MTAPPPPSAILLMGPTASGKSVLALRLASRLGGRVINADALQVYGCWRLLTARPSAEDEAEAPHALYGHIAGEDRFYSVGRWLREAAPMVSTTTHTSGPAIIVGGTGLNFSALTRGLAPIPEIAPAVRAAVEARFDRAGHGALLAELRARDPETAARIDVANPRRLVRALEVLDGTDVGLAAWARRTEPPLLPAARALRFRLEPPAAAAAAAIEARLRAMASAGVLEEVAAAAGLDPAAPAAKALGRRPFAAHLAGTIDLETALSQAAAETRRYAKRQRTWGRNQLGDWETLPPDPAEALSRVLDAAAAKGLSSPPGSAW